MNDFILFNDAVI